MTVYLTSAGALAYGVSTDLGRVTVRSVYDDLDVFEKDLARRSVWLMTTPRPGRWLPDDPDRDPSKEVRDGPNVWKGIGLHRVVEALERIAGLSGDGTRT